MMYRFVGERKVRKPNFLLSFFCSNIHSILYSRLLSASIICFWSIQHPPPPRPTFPCLLISRLLMKDWVQSRDSGGGDRKNRLSDEKGRSLDQLSVCQNMSTRLSPCLLSSLMWVPHWALHEDHSTAVALRASLSCSIKIEREGSRQTVRGERLITCFNNGD